jgi:hypothetical protein
MAVYAPLSFRDWGIPLGQGQAATIHTWHYLLAKKSILYLKGTLTRTRHREINYAIAMHDLRALTSLGST